MGRREIHFTTQTCHRSFEKIFSIVEGKLHAFRYTIKLLDSNCTCTIKAICDPNWMYASVK